jgi:hypothetical protein
MLRSLGSIHVSSLAIGGQCRPIGTDRLPILGRESATGGSMCRTSTIRCKQTHGTHALETGQWPSTVCERCCCWHSCCLGMQVRAVQCDNSGPHQIAVLRVHIARNDCGEASGAMLANNLCIAGMPNLCGADRSTCTSTWLPGLGEHTKSVKQGGGNYAAISSDMEPQRRPH